MFRNTMIALTAAAAVAGAAMLPTAASAHHHHGHHHHGHFHGGFGITIAAPSCWQYQLVETRRGLRRMLVNVCAY